ncbi:HAD-IA family hydrolase [Treponema sp. OMZ 840]|uniref:HAD-IA family hydrolase n=1 Tax=Treponema sp. OMZ 840 TaxID=244313 RepID=UPI003D8DACEA
MIKNLLFDLDDTLYCSSSSIGPNTRKRMIRFIARFLNKSEEEVMEERSRRVRFYSTTLEWIVREHGFSDIDSYFRFIHPDEEVNEIEFDPGLRPLLESLNKTYHLSLLTNSPAIHFEKILKHLNVYDLFDGIYGIEENKFQGKPAPQAYLNAVTDKGFTVENTLFIDDLPKYIKGYSALGGKAVLIDETGRFAHMPLVEEAPFARLKSVHELPALLKKLQAADSASAAKKTGVQV